MEARLTEIISDYRRLYHKEQEKRRTLQSKV